MPIGIVGLERKFRIPRFRSFRFVSFEFRASHFEFSSLAPGLWSRLPFASRSESEIIAVRLQPTDHRKENDRRVATQGFSRKCPDISLKAASLRDGETNRGLKFHGYDLTPATRGLGYLKKTNPRP